MLALFKVNSFFLIAIFSLWNPIHAAGKRNPEILKADSTLELVHLLFAHGDVNPAKANMYPSDPYYDEAFYPEGYDQLVNSGKRKIYRIGRRLSQRYGSFLGPTWHIDTTDLWTTDTNRTKMSAELMVAGLFPPMWDQIWTVLMWQPIPYNYVPMDSDKVLAPFSACGAQLRAETEKVYDSEMVQEYLLERYGQTLEKLNENIGKDEVNLSISMVSRYYSSMFMQKQLGLRLPSWTELVFPEPLQSMAIDDYYIQTNTTTQRRILAGYLLEKILSDTKSKIDGTFKPPKRKMFIYSAHEINVIAMVLSLEAYKLTKVPRPGSYVLFEVHKVNGVHGFKLFFQNYDKENPEPIQLPGCDQFCPYDEFIELVERVIPKPEDDCTG